MGHCFGSNGHNINQSANQLRQQSHRQIELHLREDETSKKRVFFTGSPECIMNIFDTIDGNPRLHQIQNCCTLLVFGYIRKLKLQFHFYIPFELQSLCTTFYGNIEAPNHYEFAPIIDSVSPTSSSIDTKDNIDEYIDYQLNFCNSSVAPQLNITYHNLQCFEKKKDYYLKWIHLLDDSLSVIYVADLAQNTFLLKDLEKFKRLMYYSNGKYDSKMPILVLSGIHEFNQSLSKQIYRKEFEAQFNEFELEYNELHQNMYYQEALQHIKNQYLAVFEKNLVHGIHHWTKRKRRPHKLFIRTINDVNDMKEVQNVWRKLNKTLIHGNIMHELRTGGIAL